MNNQPENNIKNGYAFIQGAEVPFSERFINDMVRITLPTEFKQMEKRYVKAKYPAYNKKNAIVLTNENTTINFLFDFKDGHIEPGTLEDVRDQVLEILNKVHPTLVFLGKSMVKMDELEVAYFEIITPALDKDIYNFMYFFELNDKFVSATFNCFEDEKEDWRPVLLQVVESLKIAGV